MFQKLVLVVSALGLMFCSTAFGQFGSFDYTDRVGDATDINRIAQAWANQEAVNAAPAKPVVLNDKSAPINERFFAWQDVDGNEAIARVVSFVGKSKLILKDVDGNTQRVLFRQLADESRQQAISIKDEWTRAKSAQAEAGESEAARKHEEIVLADTDKN